MHELWSNRAQAAVHIARELRGPLSVVVVGLEQDQAPLDVLERVAIVDEQMGKAFAVLRERANLSEVVILSTCLRTELYAVVERFHEGVADLQEFLAATAGTTTALLEDKVTVLFDDQVAVHLFEVASGMRSAVLGETEVLGQVRRALERAEEERASGPVLGSLFRRAVQVGRRVRTDTGISRGTTSLSHTAVQLAAQEFGGSLAGLNVLVVGAGEMGEGTVGALAKRDEAIDVVVANRTASRAVALAERIGGTHVSLSVLGEALEVADVVLVSTTTTTPLLDETLMEGVLERRSTSSEGTGEQTPDGVEARRPLVIVDLGLPRNVDPNLRGRAGLRLFDMDDLRGRAETAVAGRQAEMATAEMIVMQEVERYRSDTRARGAAPVISALRSQFEQVRLAELERHRSRLADLTEVQQKEVDAVTKAVLAKVLHTPTVAVKEATGTPRGERLVEALRSLFDL